MTEDEQKNFIDKLEDPRILICRRPDETTDNRIISLNINKDETFSFSIIKSFKEALKKRKYSLEDLKVKNIEEMMKESDEHFLIPKGENDENK